MFLFRRLWPKSWRRRGYRIEPNKDREENAEDGAEDDTEVDAEDEVEENTEADAYIHQKQA